MRSAPAPRRKGRQPASSRRCAGIAALCIPPPNRSPHIISPRRALSVEPSPNALERASTRCRRGARCVLPMDSVCKLNMAVLQMMLWRLPDTSVVSCFAYGCSPSDHVCALRQPSCRDHPTLGLLRTGCLWTEIGRVEQSNRVCSACELGLVSIARWAARRPLWQLGRGGRSIAKSVCHRASTAAHDSKQSSDRGVVRGGGAYKDVGFRKRKEILQCSHAKRLLELRRSTEVGDRGRRSVHSQVGSEPRQGRPFDASRSRAS